MYSPNSKFVKEVIRPRFNEMSLMDGFLAEK
jgi:hypothetical protein